MKTSLCASVLIVLTAALVGCSSLVSIDMRNKPTQPKSSETATASVRMSTAQLKVAAILKKRGVQLIRLGETERLVLSSDDLFQPDSANLRPSGKKTLCATARYLKTYDKSMIKIASYSDNRGTVKRLAALTVRQSQIVLDYLWARGVDARLVYATGHNRLNPVDFNNMPYGRHYNRRVEISFFFIPKVRAYD